MVLGLLNYTFKPGGIFMPYFHFSEFWTPLKIIGIRFYRDEDHNTWIKIWNKPRRML